MGNIVEMVNHASHALKPRINFLSTLAPAFQKDNLLPFEFTIHELEDCVMQLLVAVCLEKLRRDLRTWQSCQIDMHY